MTIQLGPLRWLALCVTLQAVAEDFLDLSRPQQRIAYEGIAEFPGWYKELFSKIIVYEMAKRGTHGAEAFLAKGAGYQ